MMWPSPQPEKMSIVNTIYKQRFLPCVEYWARAFAQNLWSTLFLGPVSQEWCKNIYIHFYTCSKEQIEQFALRKIHFSKLIKKYLSVRTWSKNINTLFLWSMFHTHIIQLFLNPYRYNKKEGELSQMIWGPKAIIRSRPWGDHVTSGQQSDNVRIIHAGTLSIQKNFDEDVWNEKKSWRILWPQWNYLWWICLNIWSGPGSDIIRVSFQASHWSTHLRLTASLHLPNDNKNSKPPSPVRRSRRVIR